MAIAFAPGEGWAAWLEPPLGSMRSFPLHLYALDLRRPGSEPLESPVAYDRTPEALALSADGARIAAVQGGRLLVAEVATGNPIASAKLPAGVELWAVAEFAGADRVRLRGFRSQGAAAVRYTVWQTWELDLANRQLRPMGDFGPYKRAWSAGGERAVRFNPDLRALEILDGWTGRTLTWRPWPEEPPSSMSLLSDGRVALVEPAGGGSEVRLLAPDLSAELRRIPLTGEAALLLRGQPGPDLLVAVTGPPDLRKTFRTLLLDLAAGSSRELGRGLTPMAPRSGPGSAGSRLFQTRSRQILQLDPRTGSLHPFLGAEGRS
jgi:hypothetical protein